MAQLRWQSNYDVCDPVPSHAVLPNCGCRQDFHLPRDKKRLDAATRRLSRVFTQGASWRQMCLLITLSQPQFRLFNARWTVTHPHRHRIGVILYRCDDRCDTAWNEKAVSPFQFLLLCKKQLHLIYSSHTVLITVPCCVFTYLLVPEVIYNESSDPLAPHRERGAAKCTIKPCDYIKSLT